jgi:choice-of-anchor C domain-containing protein
MNRSSVVRSVTLLALLVAGPLRPACFALWDTSTASDSVNLIVNGSFESGPAVIDYLPLDEGSTAIDGWVVTRGQIDYVAVWQSFDGVRSIDLDGSPSLGGIAQAIPTTPGARYEVTFAIAGNSHGPPEPKKMRVAAAGQATVVSFDATGTTYEAMGWERRRWTFIATSPVTTLEFSSADPDPGMYGPALDSVTVRATAFAVDSTVLGLWRFDEGVGFVAHDASPYGNDATIHSAGWVPGVSGSGLSFNGLTSYVLTSASASLLPAGDFMVDVWFSPDTFHFDPVPLPDSGHGVILSTLGPYPSGGGYQLAVREGGFLQWDYRVGSPISRFGGYVPLPQTRRFYHAQAFYLRVPDFYGTWTLIKTYVDGVLADSSVYLEPLHYANSDNFYIGTNIDGRAVGGPGVREFSGVIDEVMIRSIRRTEIPPEAVFGAPLTVSNGLHTRTLYFGTHPTATYCLDPWLGELELPPLPPAGAFDARFREPRPNPVVPCFGQGFGNDFRPRAGDAAADTFRLLVQPGEAGYPVVLTWHRIAELFPGQVWLTDAITGSIVRVDMRADWTFTITSSLTRQLLIIAEHSGAVPATSYRTFGQAEYAERARPIRAGNPPTAANVRDATFLANGWFDQGLYVGVPRPDSTLFYGWVYFRHNLARLARFLPHTGAPRGFDFYIGGKPWHYSRANPAVKYHNNHLAGEQYILKFNVGASDARITPEGFGELLYLNPNAPAARFNGRTVRELMAHTDSALTFCRSYPADYFVELDSVLSMINAAFQGPVTAYSVSPLVVGGARALSEVPFLHANPGARPAVRPPAPVPADEEPSAFALAQNYPNPFNPVTTIEFDLPVEAVVTVRVYNTLGQEVAALLDHAPLEAGRQSIDFDGGALPSGVYLCRVEMSGTEEAAPQSLVRKMLLMR